MRIRLWKVVEYDGNNVPTLRNIFASEDEAQALYDGLDLDRKVDTPGCLAVEEMSVRVRNDDPL